MTSVQRLILQPNVGAHIVRKWLLENEWELIDERILEEDGQMYEVLVAERGDPYRPYTQLHVELLLGPFLLKERNEVFEKMGDGNEALAKRYRAIEICENGRCSQKETTIC